jgi:hypothetical protein
MTRNPTEKENHRKRPLGTIEYVSTQGSHVSRIVGNVPDFR